MQIGFYLCNGGDNETKMCSALTAWDATGLDAAVAARHSLGFKGLPEIIDMAVQFQ